MLGIATSFVGVAHPELAARNIRIIVPRMMPSQLSFTLRIDLASRDLRSLSGTFDLAAFTQDEAGTTIARD